MSFLRGLWKHNFIKLAVITAGVLLFFRYAVSFLAPFLIAFLFVLIFLPFLKKINAKTKTLYLYLALNPEELQGTKYFFDDVSSKKKYAAVPVLMKIKGERKFKHALELIEKLCGEQMALPAVKDFQEQNYVEEYRTTDALVQEGYIKQLTAEIPAEVTGEISLF